MPKNLIRGSLPKIGVFSGQYALGAMPAPEARRFMLDLEELGYGMVWISEAFGKEVMSHAALLLGYSENLLLGTGIANMWARDPVAMANGGRTLADAFPGRLVLGVGISHRVSVVPRGHRYSSSVATMRTYLEEMELAPWRGLTKPDVPLLVGSLGPKMTALAAELTDGVHPYLVTPWHTAETRRIIGPGSNLVPEQAVLIQSDPDIARSWARVHLSRYLERPNYSLSFQRQGFAPHEIANGGNDRLVDAAVAWGDPETVARRIREHLDAGADQVAIQAIGPDERDSGLETLTALAPHLSDLLTGIE